jgi:FAD/FMN-containing dehydrogenase/Fe-S oxidoreductase
MLDRMPLTLNSNQLGQALKLKIQGEVRFDAGSRALYATDSSNYRQVPIGVVLPRDVDDVVEAVAICRQFGAPILPRGGGTSLAGQCCNVAVVLDMSKYLREPPQIDPAAKQARVQPGVVLDVLRKAAEKHHLTFAPDPSTHGRCTLGGMIGNNSCGTHSLMGGNTVDNVEELDVLTYDGLRLTVGKTSEDELKAIIRQGGRRGEIYAGLKALRDEFGDLVRQRFPRIPRRISGYNLDQLLPENGFHVARALVGTEGTCVTVLGARLRLVDSPRARSLLVLGFADCFEAADQVMEILPHHPIALEGIEQGLIRYLQRHGMHQSEIDLLPPGGSWLFAEFGGQTREAANEKARALMADFQKRPAAPAMKLIDDPKLQRKVWEVREAGLAATSRDESGQAYWSGWEDSAVAPEVLGSYLRDLHALLGQFHYGGSLYGHFGQGCVHIRINFDLKTETGIQTFRKFMMEAAALVARYHGSLSGEHGDGQARAELYPALFGEALVTAFRRFKAVWDREGRMNPGKLVDPYRIDENLRLGAGFSLHEPAAHFKFPEDHGSFAETSLRCVGFGQCRQASDGGMCPSYRATSEEMHSTRGRARLLFEMLKGEVITQGWRDEHVKEALDLCLACKACKTECPVNVDMASYKAEFFSHYYEGRLRPRSAYAFGLIESWARLISPAAPVANFLAHAPALGRIAKWASGMAVERQVPRFATHSFRKWWRSRPKRNPQGPPVILWADTFNNYLTPQVAIAAVEVLEAAGFQPVVPVDPLCCGRPLYDFGFLDRARKSLEKVLRVLRPMIEAGTPVVGLEPACVSVFKDELLNLFPDNPLARKLAGNTFLLSGFLAAQAPRLKYTPLNISAIYHGHCHQKALQGIADELSLLEKLGVTAEQPESGCCGMAGSFGFEREHYAVSIKAGENALLPAVRAASDDTLIIADGYSCREQIAQSAGRQAVHLAEVIQIALSGGKERQS